VQKAICIFVFLESLVMYQVSFLTYVNVALFFLIPSLLFVLFGWLCVDCVYCIYSNIRQIFS
jgi:hypothetical protein